MRIALWFLLSLLTLGLPGCAHTPRKQPKQRLPTAAAAPAEASGASEAQVPELIEVRLLVVAYQGAVGAQPSEARTKEQALERANMIARMARSGDKLAELVRKYSDLPGAASDFGLFRIRPAQPGAFGAQVAEAAAELAPGSIGSPVDGPQGWFVIERRNDPPGGPSRVAAKHILIGFKGSQHPLPGVTRTEAEARSLAEQVAREAHEEGADWNALAAKYTDEPGSKETGGDLGKFGRGQMVPAFENAAFSLPVGQVSSVIQSPFGFHVIYRYE